MWLNVGLNFIIDLIEDIFGHLEWVSVLHFLILVVNHFPLNVLHVSKVSLVVSRETQFVSDDHYMIKIGLRHYEHGSKICNDNQDGKGELKEKVEARVRRVLRLLGYLPLWYHAWLWTASECVVHPPFLRASTILGLYLVLFVVRGERLKELIATSWHLRDEGIRDLYKQE